jgi:hypothetical protein
MEERGSHRFDGRRLFGACVVMLLVAVPYGGYEYFMSAHAVPPLSIGSIFPKASLSTLSQGTITTDSLITQKSLVAFISTSCQLCRNEILSLDSIGRMGGDSLTIIVLSLNSRKDTELFRKALHCSLPIYLINDDEARQTYHITSLPLLFFVGERREITSIASSVICDTEIINPIP